SRRCLLGRSTGGVLSSFGIKDVTSFEEVPNDGIDRQNCRLRGTAKIETLSKCLEDRIDNCGSFQLRIAHHALCDLVTLHNSVFQIVELKARIRAEILFNMSRTKRTTSYYGGV